jgi:dolichyl-phosphate beta-glucosyltransferase
MFLSVVIPAYNEEKHILATLEKIARFLSAKSFLYEIIVVDDGSRDRTYETAKGFAQSSDRVRVLQNSVNEGKGSAVRKGVMASGGKYVLFLDADYSTSIEEIDKMLPLLEMDDRYDFVIASRHIEGARILRDEPFIRVFFGKIYHVLVKLLFLRGVSDYNCGFKLYRREVARDLFSRILIKDYTFDAELLFLAQRLRYRYKEMPVTWRHNPHSKVRPFVDGIKTLRSLIEIQRNYRRGYYRI